MLCHDEVLAIRSAAVFTLESSLSGIIRLNPCFSEHLMSNNAIIPLSYREVAKSTVSDIVIVDNSPDQSEGFNYLRELKTLELKVPEGHLQQLPPGCIGLHIRLTDFRHAAGMTEQNYASMIKMALKNSELMAINTEERPVFVATDEEAGEDIAREIFRIVVPSIGRTYVEKFDPVRDWGKNCDRNESSVFSALKDLIHLSRCDIRIGLGGSSFFQLSREMAAAHYMSLASMTAKTEEPQTISHCVSSLLSANQQLADLLLAPQSLVGARRYFRTVLSKVPRGLKR